MQFDPAHLITDEATPRTQRRAHDLAVKKCLPHLSSHAREFIARSPFLCIGTQNRDGRADVSPRGDPVGFVRVLDDRTLAIPDRPGNNRLDTLVNILSNPNVGLLFVVPGFEDAARQRPGASRHRPGAAADHGRAGPGAQARHRGHGAGGLHALRQGLPPLTLVGPGRSAEPARMPSLVKIIPDETTGAPPGRDAQAG